MLTRFMRALGIDGFEAPIKHASPDPSGFHDAQSRFVGYRFECPYEPAPDRGEGKPFAHWCSGSETNVVVH